MQRSLLLVATLCLLACASGTESTLPPDTVNTGGAGGASGAGGGAGSSGAVQIGGEAGMAGGPLELPEGSLTGTVMAPSGTIPIAGALLYLSKEKPAPMPEQVYCDTCVELKAGDPHALTDEKGAFELKPAALGAQYLVLQKGGFRRVREVYVSKAGEKLPSTLTTLPPKTDLEAGDEVPRMTVVKGAYDEIEASLHKLGIAPEAIEIVESPLIGKAATEFLTDGARVNGRHIVFLPCGDYTQPDPNVDLSKDPQIQENLKAFVQSGGRLYVTDWHYDFINRTFPGYITWSGASDIPCSACQKLSYDAAAQVVDEGLASWLAGQSLSSFTLQKNYTSIAAVHPVEATGSDGKAKTVTPRVWVNGKVGNEPPHPATVSFEDGCGRVLFSTYHTEPFSTELTPQERALLGVLLEVSVCNDSDTGILIK